MAARTKKLQLTEAWKDKIKLSVISGRLYDHMQGFCDMTPTQVRAAEILLKKLVPDLSAVDGRIEHSGGITVNIKQF